MRILLLTLIFGLFIACEQEVKTVTLNQKVGKSAIDQAYCTIEHDLDGSLMSCPNGSLNYLVINTNNPDNCEAIQLPIGVLYTCENTVASIIENSFESRVLVSEIIDPCGAQTVNDELLLLLDDGRFFSFREALTGLSFEEKFAGSYVTEDGTSCSYQI